MWRIWTRGWGLRAWWYWWTEEGLPQSKPLADESHRDMWKHLQGATGRVVEQWHLVSVVRLDNGRIETHGYPFWRPDPAVANGVH